MSFNPNDHIEEKEFLGRNKKSSKFLHVEDVADKETAREDGDIRLQEAPNPGEELSEKEYEARKRRFEVQHEIIKKELGKQYAQYSDERVGESTPVMFERKTQRITETAPSHESMAMHYRKQSYSAIPFQAKDLSRPDGTGSNNNGKDNFKTLPAPRRIRSWREKIRDFLHFQDPHTEVNLWQTHEDHLDGEEEQKEKNIQTLMKDFKDTSLN